MAKDNIVILDGVRLQLPKQPGRTTGAGLRVLVRRHLDGTHLVWWGTRRLNQAGRAGQQRSDHVSNVAVSSTCS